MLLCPRRVLWIFLLGTFGNLGNFLRVSRKPGDSYEIIMKITFYDKPKYHCHFLVPCAIIHLHSALHPTLFVLGHVPSIWNLETPIVILQYSINAFNRQQGQILRSVNFELQGCERKRRQKMISKYKIISFQSNSDPDILTTHIESQSNKLYRAASVSESKHKVNFSWLTSSRWL